jgi:hypothetical protein
VSRILDCELGGTAAVVRPRLPSLFEPGLLKLRTGSGPLLDEVPDEPDAAPRRQPSEGGRRRVSRMGRAGEASTGEAAPARTSGPRPGPERTRQPSSFATPSVPDVASTVEVPRSRSAPGPLVAAHDADVPPTVRKRVQPPPAEPDEGEDRRRRRAGGDPLAPEAVPPRRLSPSPAAPLPAPRPASGSPDGEAGRRTAGPLVPAMSPPPVAAAPVVRIAIGRIEVRGGRLEPAQPPAPRSGSRRTPRLTLSEYLDQRQEHGR